MVGRLGAGLGPVGDEVEVELEVVLEDEELELPELEPLELELELELGLELELELVVVLEELGPTGTQLFTMAPGGRGDGAAPGGTS